MPLFVCVCLPHLPLTHTHTQTHLFCPSQSSGYPASQQRITALCHVAVTSLSHISLCHSLQGEKGTESLTVSNRYLSLSFCLFCQCTFFPVFLCNTLSLLCCVTGVLCKYQMLDNARITSCIHPVQLVLTRMNTY